MTTLRLMLGSLASTLSMVLSSLAVLVLVVPPLRLDPAVASLNFPLSLCQGSIGAQWLPGHERTLRV